MSVWALERLRLDTRDMRERRCGGGDAPQTPLLLVRLRDSSTIQCAQTLPTRENEKYPKVISVRGECRELCAVVDGKERELRRRRLYVGSPADQNSGGHLGREQNATREVACLV